MPDEDHTPVDGPETNPAPPPDVSWHTFRLRKLNVATTAVNGKYCRVSEIGEGYHAIEVEGLEPVITEEQFGICQNMAELSALAGRPVRRFVAADGEATYR
jgi:hypothetical protein